MSISWQGSVVFFGTRDLEAVDRFYRQCLGLPLFKDQGLCRIYDVPGGGRVGFCTHLTAAPLKKSPIITLLAQDVDQAYEQLIECGYQPDTEPKVHDNFHIYHFFVQDPSGYTLEIQRFLDD